LETLLATITSNTGQVVYGSSGSAQKVITPAGVTLGYIEDEKL